MASVDSSGVRRGPKPPRPKLPLSAFMSPPNTGTSDSFPIPHEILLARHPEYVLDGHVITHNGDLGLSQWKAEVGQALGERMRGVILSLEGPISEEAMEKLRYNDPPIISVSAPFSLEKEESPPAYIFSSSIPFHLSTVFTKSTEKGTARLRWALEQGRPVEIDIQSVISDEVLESLEDIIQKATDGISTIPPIILSNVLPPPHDLELPIVKLMNHPTYSAFQCQVSALSLLPYVSVKFLPPSWDAPTPPTPSAEVAEITDSKQHKEWKRRIKMYLGPVIEAFGYERVIFGSSPCPTSRGSSLAGNWYELARESLGDLAVDQEVLDAIFYQNAKKVYSPA